MLAGFLKVSYSNLFILWAGNRDPKGRKQGVNGEAKASRSCSLARALFSSLRFSHCHLGCLSYHHPEEGLGSPSPKEEPANPHFPVTYWESGTATFAPQEAGV